MLILSENEIVQAANVAIAAQEISPAQLAMLAPSPKIGLSISKGMQSVEREVLNVGFSKESANTLQKLANGFATGRIKLVNRF